MLEIGKQWIFEDINYSFWLPFPDTTIEAITIIADTTVNSKLYKKLILSRHPICWNTGIVEYLREEGDKIFRLSRSFDQEFLMIDFGEDVGYELLFNHSGGDIDTGTVVIDSFGTEYAYDGTQLDVQYMRILNNLSYDDDTQYKVYKNIGFLYPGFLFPEVGTNLCDFQDEITLRCVAIEQDTIRFTEFDCFDLQIVNNIIPAITEAITIGPNPTIDYVSIPSGFVFLDLFDLCGSIFRPNYDLSQIYLHDFPAGTYFVRFIDSTKNQIYIGRILKPY